MKVKNNQRLNDLKDMAIDTSCLKSVKGGNIAYGSWLPDGGGSRPKKPTGSTNSYMSFYFGG